MRRTSNSAYPKVISNLGALQDGPDTMVAIKMIRFMNHFARSTRERRQIIDFFIKNEHVDSRYRETPTGAPIVGPPLFDNHGGKLNTVHFMPFMNDYFAVGFANTLGYAHATCGDTMTSVMIGGLRTVMNGDFEIFTGDVVQFYWAFEKDDFEQDGRRKAYKEIWFDGKPHNLDPSFSSRASKKRDAGGQLVTKGSTWSTPEDAQVRQAHHNLGYGQRKDRQKIVAKIKPYFRDEEHPRLMDWYRVFGVAIASARPNEMCDIKISRQSM